LGFSERRSGRPSIAARKSKSEDPDALLVPAPPSAGPPAAPSPAAIILGGLAALLYAVPVALTLLVGVTIGDCGEDVPCHQHDGPLLLTATAVALGLAGRFGLAVGRLVHWAQRRRAGATPGAAPVWRMAWEIIAASMLGLIGVVCVLALFGLY
jgi:hypothetical protein